MNDSDASHLSFCVVRNIMMFGSVCVLFQYLIIFITHEFFFVC